MSTSLSPDNGFIRDTMIEISGKKRGVLVFGARNSKLVTKTVQREKLLSEEAEVLLSRNSTMKIVDVSEQTHPATHPKHPMFGKKIIVYHVEVAG